MSAAWCMGSIFVGLLLLALGIASRVRFPLPYLGTASGSVGAILLIIGFSGGVFGFCPF